MYYNPDHKYRRGNTLPPVTNQDTAKTPDRENMLYSYQNTVESSYTGDIRHFVTKFGEYLKTKNQYFDLVKNEYNCIYTFSITAKHVDYIINQINKDDFDLIISSNKFNI